MFLRTCFDAFVFMACLTWSPRPVFVPGLWDVRTDTTKNRSDLAWDVGTGTLSFRQKEVMVRACVLEVLKNSRFQIFCWQFWAYQRGGRRRRGAHGWTDDMELFVIDAKMVHKLWSEMLTALYCIWEFYTLRLCRNEILGVTCLGLKIVIW